MKVTDWIVLAFSRPWQFFKESFSGRKELVPLEEDPVGEFLDRKKSGINLAEEENDEEEEHKTVGETSQAAVVVTGDEVKEEKIELVVVSKINDEQELNESSVAEKNTGELPVASSVEAKPEETQPVNKASEEPVETEDKPQALEAVNQDTESSNQPPAEKPKGAGDKDTDSLLDIFRSEQGEMDTLGPLSEELSDMSIYSLLEEGKKIVAKIKGGHDESS
jgi:hypothetical protein